MESEENAINSETLVTMYCAHQASVESLNLNKEWNLEFQNLLLQNILKSKVNLKGLFLVLSQTSKKSQKRKENLSLVYNLGISGISSLKLELSTV